MAYFLGRDIAVGISTEQPHYGIEFTSGDIAISGTASNAYDESTEFIPKRTGVAEVTKIAIVSTASASDFESTASNNKYFLVYDTSGQKYLIWFDEGTDDAVKPTGLNEDFNIEVVMSGANNVAMATTLRNALSGDSDFAAAFTVSPAASGSDNNVIFTDKDTGSATDIVRGSGFDNTIATISTNTEGTGVDDSVNVSDNEELKVSDVTGIDLTLGKTDEDIGYFGQRTGLKAEIKDEVTLVITRKKSDASFDLLFNKARCGIRATTAFASVPDGGGDAVEFNANENIPFANATGSGFGYRLYLQLKAGTEVLTLRNMCITDFSVSLGADSVQEESITFYGNTKPLISTVATNTITAIADF